MIKDVYFGLEITQMRYESNLQSCATLSSGLGLIPSSSRGMSCPFSFLGPGKPYWF